MAGGNIHKDGVGHPSSKIPRWARYKSSFHLFKRKENKMRRTLAILSWSLVVLKKTKER
jgi:hypothetical protein